MLVGVAMLKSGGYSALVRWELLKISSGRLQWCGVGKMGGVEKKSPIFEIVPTPTAGLTGKRARVEVIHPACTQQIDEIVLTARSATP
jgi:hypothetical protein